MRTKVARAVFLAAGTGSRLRPITNTCPKPLVRVNGRRIIDTLLDAVLMAGIEEIHIVCGYLAESFDMLHKKYPMIHLIGNPHFQDANNISSILAAQDYLENAYILESDLLLQNPSLIRAEEERSNYLAIPVSQTDDWAFRTNDAGKIVSLLPHGGRAVDKMVGISWWSAADAKRLVTCTKKLWRAGKTALYWDEVALDVFHTDFSIYVRHCNEADVTEIDTMAELAALDAGYASMRKD